MSPIGAERRAELLAIADRTELIALAERCAAQQPGPTVLSPPEVGTIVVEVREPIAHERFHLSEVLACRAEVLVGEGHGWSIRLGDDRLATLAAAVCDAEVDDDRPLAAEVVALCHRTEARAAAEKDAEWAELSATEVTFEELD